jgi:hypothetical protein
MAGRWQVWARERWVAAIFAREIGEGYRGWYFLGRAIVVCGSLPGRPAWSLQRGESSQRPCPTPLRRGRHSSAGNLWCLPVTGIFGGRIFWDSLTSYPPCQKRSYPHISVRCPTYRNVLLYSNKALLVLPLYRIAGQLHTSRQTLNFNF